jgi:glycosyltransferase involved in cell wall biosynthesis
MIALRVLIVSTPFISVPPITYGGLERVVYDLAFALRRQWGISGLAVACPHESNLPEKVQHLDIGPARYLVQQDWAAAEKEAYGQYERYLGDYDIIHDNTWTCQAYVAKQKNPDLKLVHTHHGHIAWRERPPVKYLNLVGISRFMQATYRNIGLEARFVYNGVATSEYPYNESRGERLLYLGRITKFKQPHVAVEIAKQAGVGIDIVGGDHFVDDFNYVAAVRNKCDGDQARYLGEVPHDLKIKYLLQSRALCVPSAMGEPFGLVAIEALATGRPVICLNDGALGEIIVNGVNGFVCDSPQEMVEVIKQKKDLELIPRDCRSRAMQFSRESMAENYMQLFQEVQSGLEW